MVYEVQQEKHQDGKKRIVLHRNMLLPCETILKEPKGFHLEKEKQKKLRKIITSHKIASASNTT